MKTMRLLLLFLFLGALTSCEKDSHVKIQDANQEVSEFANLNITVMLNDGENGQSCTTPGSHEYGIEDAKVFLYDESAEGQDDAQFIQKKSTDRTGVASFQQLNATGYFVRVESPFGLLERTLTLYRGENKHILFMY